MGADVSVEFSQIYSAFILSFAKNSLISPTENSRVYLLQNGLWGGNSKTEVVQCGVDSANSLGSQSI